MVENERMPLSNSGGHENKRQIHFLVRTQHNNMARDSRVKWQRSIVSTRKYPLFCQPIRNWGIKLTSVSVKLSHTHYYTLSHTILFSLTHTTIFYCINNYTLSHTLLYSLTYTTILSHIHDYSLSHTLLYFHIHDYTLSYIHCGNPSLAQRPWRPRGQVVEAVYHRFSSDGASKSMGANHWNAEHLRSSWESML